MHARGCFHYVVVDVFTRNLFEGNALAVFPDAVGLDDATMQRIARELNLSETVFIFPSALGGCVARLRIFAPLRELNFAGHPTLGAAFVLLKDNPAECFSVEENVGPVRVRVEKGGRPLIWLTTPPIAEGPTFSRQLCAAALSLPEEELTSAQPRLLDAGNPTLFIALKDKQAVDRAVLDHARFNVMKALRPGPFCVFPFTPTIEGAYSRMFAPDIGIPEDPATGSSSGPLALYMMRHEMVPSADGTRFVSEQGTAMGRRSLLHVHVHGRLGADGIEVGGFVTPVAAATLAPLE
jgi:trans-2,3-dihydro-3-hydroxyanthranilate isomerase